MRRDKYSKIDISDVILESFDSGELILGVLNKSESTIGEALAQFRKAVLLEGEKDLDVGRKVILDNGEFTMIPIEEDFESQCIEREKIDINLSDAILKVKSIVGFGHWEAIPVWFNDVLSKCEFLQCLAYSETEDFEVLIKHAKGYLYLYEL